jgi:hypothetical protein
MHKFLRSLSERVVTILIQDKRSRKVSNMLRIYVLGKTHCYSFSIMKRSLCSLYELSACWGRSECSPSRAVSPRLPSSAVRIRAKVTWCGICGVQSGTGAGLLQVFRFPLTLTSPIASHSSSSIIRGWYNSQKSGWCVKWTEYQRTLSPWLESTSELYLPSDTLVSEVSAKFCGQTVPRGQRDGSLRSYSRLFRRQTLLFLPSSSSFVMTRLSGPRSRPTT